MAFTASLRGGRQTHMGERPVDTMPQTSAGRTVTHKNVQEALVAILDELPAIGKNQRAPAVMGGYGFRGIDDVLNALNPLLGKHGVFYLPCVRDRIDGQFTNAKGNITWTVKLEVAYVFHCTAEPDSSLTAIVWGEAHDSGDKATQKALTAAQKSMLFQVFAINTADQADSDSERHEQEEAISERPYMSALNISAFLAKGAEAGATPFDIDTIVRTATDGRTSNPNGVYSDEVTVLRAAFESWANERAQKATSSVEPKPGKSVPKRPLPQTESVQDVKTDGTLV